MLFTSAISSALCASALAAVAFLGVNTFPINFDFTERSTHEPPDAGSSIEQKSCDDDYSVDDFIYELKDDKHGLKRVAEEKWTIPANHGSPVEDAMDIKCMYPTYADNCVVWSSRTLGMYIDINIEKTTKTEKKTPASTARAASPAFLELEPQSPVSPLSTSPEFNKIRKCSAAGHALRPRSLTAAFSTADACQTPVTISQRRGKPRKPQTFNANRKLYR